MARKRLSVYDYLGVIDALRRLEPERSIARQGLASRNTIKAIRESCEPLGWLDVSRPGPSQEEVARYFVRETAIPKQASRVAAFHSKVQDWINLGLKPKQIFRRLVDLKRTNPKLPLFEGSVGSVKRYVRSLSKAEPEVHVVLNFEPGEAAQVDFGNGPKLVDPHSGKIRQTYVFVMTLCYSRHMYCELVWDQKVETWLRCHHNAFSAFGGVPRRVIIDNLKSAITKACRRDPVVQRSYFEFARAWNFKIDPNPPASPWLKGRVEAGVKYVKGAVFCREFSSFAEAQRILDEFVFGEAGNRVHGTTQQLPLTVFAEEDRPALTALPDPIPTITHWARLCVHTTTHVYFSKAHYSVPYRYVKEYVWLKAGLKMVEIMDEHTGEVIALHPAATRPGQFRTCPEHYPPEKRGPLELNGEACIQKASSIGTQVGQLMRQLLGNQVLERLGARRGLLALERKYGAVRLEAACDRALQHDLISYTGVRRILEKGLDQVTLPNSGCLPFPEFAPTRFSRSIGEMLKEAM